MGIHGIRILTRVYVVSKIFFSFKNTRTLLFIFSLKTLAQPCLKLRLLEADFTGRINTNQMILLHSDYTLIK
ncbi:hypothetical protein Hanom_Chr07g00613611 [Helianthus anomalus]